jgi:hypothetical protein
LFASQTSIVLIGIVSFGHDIVAAPRIGLDIAFLTNGAAASAHDGDDFARIRIDQHFAAELVVIDIDLALGDLDVAARVRAGFRRFGKRDGCTGGAGRKEHTEKGE